jgi:hypothetical protein
MQIKEFDVIEQANGKISTVLDIYTTPSLGYMVEDVDSEYQPDDAPLTYVIEPEEIKRVIEPEEATRIIDDLIANLELEFA